MSAKDFTTVPNDQRGWAILRNNQFMFWSVKPTVRACMVKCLRADYSDDRNLSILSDNEIKRSFAEYARARNVQLVRVNIIVDLTRKGIAEVVEQEVYL